MEQAGKKEEKMKLVKFLKNLNLTQEQEERVVRLLTKKFGLLPTQVELLRITKDGWVYPVGYPELSQNWDRITESIFWEEDKNV
jgi:hypothetical protein